MVAGMEQLNMFDLPAVVPHLRYRCANPACPVGEYPIDLAPHAFGKHHYCKPCRNTLRHSKDAVYRSVESRESGHASRSWPGYTGSTVLEFRLYLGHDTWDLHELASWIRDAMGQPCWGCRKPYEIRGIRPHYIQSISDAHVDVIDPSIRPGMRNLQILCVSCNTTKKDMTYAEWVAYQNVHEFYAHAEVARRTA